MSWLNFTFDFPEGRLKGNEYDKIETLSTKTILSILPIAIKTGLKGDIFYRKIGTRSCQYAHKKGFSVGVESEKSKRQALRNCLTYLCAHSKEMSDKVRSLPTL